MATPQRHVRHLRLVAGTEAAARGAVTRIEDALRCASLPDTGARLLLVRHLALGDLGRQASSQAIARVIEARFTDRAARWTRGESITGHEDSPRAEQVVFLSAWHARVALTQRLLRGAPCTAWYWPLAVPEFRVRLAAGDNIRSIMHAVAQSDEAAVALPAWALQAVQQTGAAALAAIVPAGLGEQLVRAAGLDLPSAAGLDAGLQASRSEPLQLPAWLTGLLQIAGLPARAAASVTHRSEPGAADGHASARLNREAHLPIVRHVRRGPASDAHQAAGLSKKSRAATGDESAMPSSRTRWVAVDPPSRGTIEKPAAWGTLNDAPAASQAKVLPAARQAPHPFNPTADAEPTSCAGLLFLLPVLARLGLPAWADATSSDPKQVTRVVLAAVLVHLRVARDDAVWAVVTDKDGIVAADTSAHTSRWVGGLQRWLRQGAHIGLATLVRRPGWITLTPLHIDIFFRLADADLRLRRLGLDIDPGWLSWFGRVVAYHYGEAPKLL